jgi:hypothetical protein
MPSIRRQQSNFSQLKAHEEQLERLGLLAELSWAANEQPAIALAGQRKPWRN